VVLGFFGVILGIRFWRIKPDYDSAKQLRIHRRFQFQKRGQLFIRTHNETLSVAAMRISNPDCSPIRNPIG
jgi:hypothetical protein